MASKTIVAARHAVATKNLYAMMTSISKAVGVLPVDIESIHARRDLDFERMARTEALAKWAEAIDLHMAKVGIDVTYSQNISDRMAVLRLVLHKALRSMTMKGLEEIAADLDVSTKGTVVKEEVVTRIAEHLTGKRIEVVPVDDIPAENPEALDPPLAMGDLNLFELTNEQGLKISDIEETDEPEAEVWEETEESEDSEE